MTDSDDVAGFLAFAKDLNALIPRNVQQKPPPKSTTKSASKTDTKQPNKNTKSKHPKPQAQSGSELRQRLADHLTSLKESRQSKKSFNSAESAARDQKKMLKRQSKRAKRKRLLDKQKDGGEVPKTRGNVTKAPENGQEKSSDDKFSKTESISDDGGDEDMDTGETTKPEFGNLAFITGNEATASGGKVAVTSTTKSKLEGKPSKQLLKSAQGLQNRIKYLEKTNPEKAEELKEEHRWDKAMAHSTGKKIQDDPTKIKKSLDDQSRRKQKSKKSWKEKHDKTKDDMDGRQMKRKANLQERIDGKKSKKLASARKRGRLV